MKLIHLKYFLQRKMIFWLSSIRDENEKEEEEVDHNKWIWRKSFSALFMKIVAMN